MAFTESGCAGSVAGIQRQCSNIRIFKLDEFRLEFRSDLGCHRGTALDSVGAREVGTLLYFVLLYYYL